VLTFLATYAPAAAYGNGRFPKAQAIRTIPGDAGTILLRATFGIVVSRDAGAHWRWLCEQAYGSVSTWDPPFATTRDGRIWIGMSNGLRVTKDGCEVTDVPGFEGETVMDLAEAPGGARLYVATSTPGKPSVVWRQSARGWERRGSIPDLRVDTLDVAPSDESRIYVTGYRPGVGQNTRQSVMYRSDDGGGTFRETRRVLSGLTGIIPGRIYLAAIDPKDEDRILARVLDNTGSKLALSTDGGTTFRVTLEMMGAMFGFAKADDGRTYWAGSGDPKEGIWRSRDRGEHWEPVAKSGVFCLHAAEGKLYACSNPFVPGGYAVAVSDDGGETLKALGTFDSIEGAVACDSGPGAACQAAWPAARDSIAAGGGEMSPAAPRPSSAPRASVGPSASSGASSSGASAPRSRACGCSVVGVGHGAGEGLGIVLAVLCMVHRRRARWIKGAPEPIGGHPPGRNYYSGVSRDPEIHRS
jgi:hypothetical protein